VTIYQLFYRLRARVTKQLVLGAAGAAGAAIVTVGVPVAWSHAFNRQEFVGVFAWPTDNAAHASDTVTCEASSTRNVALMPTHLETESWVAVTSGTRLSAHVMSEDATGHEDVEGFDIRRDGATAVDTITAAYKGASIGRGNYYLEREYDGVGSNHLAQQWWRGYQVSYDCRHQVNIKCPYVLGKKEDNTDMRNDPWLNQKCRLEGGEPALLLHPTSIDGGQGTGT
jgi:hypothetical protein